jgi:hypothetical protein
VHCVPYSVAYGSLLLVCMHARLRVAQALSGTHESLMDKGQSRLRLNCHPGATTELLCPSCGDGVLSMVCHPRGLHGPPV